MCAVAAPLAPIADEGKGVATCTREASELHTNSLATRLLVQTQRSIRFVPIIQEA